MLLNLDRMQTGFTIIGLLCCAAVVCRAGDAPQAWVNAVYANAVDWVSLS